VSTAETAWGGDTSQRFSRLRGTKWELKYSLHATAIRTYAPAPVERAMVFFGSGAEVDLWEASANGRDSWIVSCWDSGRLAVLVGRET
jgi:hypothetical protein